MNSKITGHATSQATQAFTDRMNAQHPAFEPECVSPAHRHRFDNVQNRVRHLPRA